MSESELAVTIGTMSGESQRLAQHTKKLTATLDTKRTEFERALAGRIDPDLFIQIVAGSFMADPDLMKCTHLSIYVAAMEAAQIGLRIDGEEAALVGWFNRDADETQAQLMTMFQGYVRLMLRAGARKVWAHVVHSADEFRYGYGLHPDLVHVPAPSEDRGDVTHAYACIILANGETQFEVMDRPELDKIRQASKASNSPAWRTWPEQMMRKAPLRRLRKYVELDAQASAAFRHEDSASIGSPVRLETFLPAQDPRNLAEKAEAASSAVQNRLRESVGAIESNGDPLDRKVEFGDHEGSTWRNVLAAPVGYGYVKHFVLEEADHQSLTAKLRTALASEVARIGGERDEHDALVAEAYEKAMRRLAKLHGSTSMGDDDSDAHAKRLVELRDAGDFDGIVALEGELKELEK